MPSPLPTPLPGWTKTLIQIGIWTLETGLAVGLDYLANADDVEGEFPAAWQHCMVVFHDPTDPETANRATCGFDFARIRGGQYDGNWDENDFITMHTQMSTFFDTYKTYMQSRIRVLEYRFYRRNFNPLPPAGTLPADDDPYAMSGPPERVYASTQVGADAGLMPPQVSISVTEKTPFPSHWGRSYLPFPGSSNVGTKGLLNASRAGLIATALGTAYANLQNTQIYPVVPVTQVTKSPARGLLLVDHVQVDDVFDVIRRRRTRTATVRSIFPATE